MSVKVTQIGALALEGNADGEWGGDAATLSTADAFPWLSFGKNQTISNVKDNSITGQAFSDLPRQVGIMTEFEIQVNAFFEGMEKFFYLAFGFVGDQKFVVVCSLTTPTTVVPGDIYEDSASNTFTVLRLEPNKAGDVYIFESDNASSTFATTAGTLTQTFGTGDATLTYTNASTAIMSEWMFELDSLSRHRELLSTAEANMLFGLTTSDYKVRMGTFGIQMDDLDHRYKNSMCQGFTFNSKAGDLSTLAFKFIGYEEERGAYGTWTIPTALQDRDKIVAHHVLGVQLGTDAGSRLNLQASDVTIDCTIPLQKVQDTVSGLYMTEPVFEGKYTCNINITLSRYSAETFQDYRDAYTDCFMRIYATQSGSSGTGDLYLLEFIAAKCTIIDAGPDDSEVAQEIISASVGKDDDFDSIINASGDIDNIIYDVTLAHDSPLMLRLRNLETTNPMSY